jgi:hydrogenase maturation factor HypF (carbamoyltransferase family)
MALAAIITHRLNMQQIIFLSDNQQLVHFLNALDQANPPEWRIKHFTQMVTNFTRQRNARILRIQRTQNKTADVRQAF